MITQFQGVIEENEKALKDKEKCLRTQEAKILDLGNDLVNCTQKLNVASNFALEQDMLAREVEE